MIRTHPGHPGTPLLDKNGQLLHPGHRVHVSAGAHQGSGSVDATDDEANKVWVRFDPQGDQYSRIFWVDVEHVSRA